MKFHKKLDPLSIWFPVLPLLMEVRSPHQTLWASGICALSFFVLAGTADFLKKITPDPLATFFRVLLLGVMGQLADDFLKVPPYWIISVVVLLKLHSDNDWSVSQSLYTVSILFVSYFTALLCGILTARFNLSSWPLAAYTVLAVIIGCLSPIQRILFEEKTA